MFDKLIRITNLITFVKDGNIIYNSFMLFLNLHGINFWNMYLIKVFIYLMTIITLVPRSNCDRP